MGLLDNAKNELDREERKSGKIPSYNKNGTVKSKWKSAISIIGIVVILIGLTIAAIHIPVMTYKPTFTAKANPMPIRPDESGIRNTLEYTKDHGSDDFDNDGLTNADEATYNTDLRNPDSDFDGISDYSEVYTFNTRPNEMDGELASYVSQLLKDNEISETAPYKIHDVVMWADNIYSRSYGTVIPTVRGYRFSRFNGWVQFPESGYAYKVANGFHYPLAYKQTENAWYVQSFNEDVEVECYMDALETEHLLTMLDKQYFVGDGILSKVFRAILPKEHSFITFDDVVKQDFADKEITATITGTEMPDFDINDMSRFGICTNSFEDLTSVLSSIKSGKPVIVSLQSSSYGEVLCLAYGYTNEYGDLLISDREGNTKYENGNPYMLDIIEKSAITIDKNGELRQREYFDFFGLGFDSTKGDKLHFIFPE